MIIFSLILWITLSGNLVYDVTNHLPNFLIINKFSSLNTKIKIFRRDYSKFNEPDLIDEVRGINWQHVLTDPDPSTLFEIFLNKMSSIIDKHLPIKRLSKKELKIQSKSWITSGIKKSIYVKNKLYQKYLKTKSQHYYSKFKIYRNKINHLLRISKKKYYNNDFIKHSKDSKRIWNGVKQIIYLKKNSNCNPTKIIYDGQELNDSKKIADAFGDYFANVEENLAREIPKVDKNHH